MALFKKKKKEENLPEPPDFLEFPEVEQYTKGEAIPDFGEDTTKLEDLETGSFNEPLERIKSWEKEKPGKIPTRLTKEISNVKMAKMPKTRPSVKPGAGGDVRTAYKSLFIRVEKFKEIVASIQLISRKLEELEDIAQRIKETKAREDSEIADWEEQLVEIRARIEKIESTLESKV